MSYHNTAGMRFGDVFVANIRADGSVQGGRRPVVVFQNNVGNRFSPNVAVLPMTSKIKKKRQITHVLLPAQHTGLHVDSMVLCENPLCLPKDSLEGYITTLPVEYLSQIAEANLYASAAIAYLSMESLRDIRDKAHALNQ